MKSIIVVKSALVLIPVMMFGACTGSPLGGSLASPVISPESGRIYDSTQVSITCSTEGASIAYTTDGTEPVVENGLITNGSAWPAPKAFAVGRWDVRAAAYAVGRETSPSTGALFVVVPDPSGCLGTLDDGGAVLSSSDVTSPSPSLLRFSIDFGTTGFDYQDLSDDGVSVYDDGAGGSSAGSRGLAMDVLRRSSAAALLQTMSQIEYTDLSGKRADFRVMIDGTPVGVTVARAYHFPPTDPYSSVEASTLLSSKLDDVALSTANAADSTHWTKQILVIVAYAPQYADQIQTHWAALDASVKRDTLVIVLATDGDDAALY